MKFAGLILISAVACVALAICSRAGESSQRNVFEQSAGLCERVGVNTAVRCIANPSHFEKVDRTNGHCYVALEPHGGHTALEVLVCDVAGVVRQTQTVTDDQLHCATAIASAAFLPDGRLEVVLHVNPSTEIAVALNCDTGDRMILAGNTFTWDAAGRHVAYFVESSQNQNPDRPTALWVDGKKISDVFGDCSELAWDANGCGLTVTCVAGDKDVQIVHVPFKQP